MNFDIPGLLVTPANITFDKWIENCHRKWYRKRNTITTVNQIFIIFWQ